MTSNDAGSTDGPGDDLWDQVDALQQQLAEVELLRSETLETIRRFEELYRLQIATRQARLESLRAEVAAARNERDLEAERRAQEAADLADSLSPKERHRNLVKRIHPDRAASETDREAREELMKKINSAMDRNDMEELDWLEAQVDLHLRDSTDAEDRDAAIGRILSRLNSRIAKLNREIHDIRDSATWRLFEETEKAREEGRDLLTEMADELDAEIATLESELADLREGVDRDDGPS